MDQKLSISSDNYSCIQNIPIMENKRQSFHSTFGYDKPIDQSDSVFHDCESPRMSTFGSQNKQENMKNSTSKFYLQDESSQSTLVPLYSLPTTPKRYNSQFENNKSSSVGSSSENNDSNKKDNKEKGNSVFYIPENRLVKQEIDYDSLRKNLMKDIRNQKLKDHFESTSTNYSISDKRKSDGCILDSEPVISSNNLLNAPTAVIRKRSGSVYTKNRNDAKTRSGLRSSLYTSKKEMEKCLLETNETSEICNKPLIEMSKSSYQCNYYKCEDEVESPMENKSVGFTDPNIEKTQVPKSPIPCRPKSLRKISNPENEVINAIDKTLKVIFYKSFYLNRELNKDFGIDSL